MKHNLPKTLIYLTLILFFIPNYLYAQTGIIKGKVVDALTNQPVEFATVQIQNTSIGATTNTEGTYEITNLKPNLYNLQVSFIGYKTAMVYEIQVTNVRPTVINIDLQANVEELKSITVKAEPFSKTAESPVSLRSVGVNEIKRNPGSNRDISKVVQSLPGVASTPTFRNDILIRGGAPSENVFYIDGIQVPVINHFATQGSSGGPVGMINVDFVREVDFYAGAFPANRENTLSSVFDFKYRKPNTERLFFTGTVGSSDAGITVEGNMSKKTNFIASARVSYLQFLFKALGLPFLPTYYDWQFKIEHNFDDKNQLTILNLGAIDNFKLNTENDTSDLQKYLLENLPVNAQRNYTFGLKYTHFGKKSYTNIIASRSYLNNSAYKYYKNIEIPENLTFNYLSKETGHRLRLENVARWHDLKLTSGASVDFAGYSNATFRKTVIADSLATIDYNSKLNFIKYGFFAQASKSYFKERLKLSAGMRLDANSFSATMGNPFKQFSPRFSASYSLFSNTSLNFNTGIYYQLPPYTALGYQQNTVFLNKNLTYIQCQHIVGGIEHLTKNNAKISIEGFYKQYNNYPFLIKDSISLANLGGDFGVIGDEKLVSTSKGRSYGIEFLVQQKLFKDFFGIIAYTFSFSEFKDKNEVYVPTSWDNRHIVNLTAGKRFKGNWEVGLKWRYNSGSPYTPFNTQTSTIIPIWNAIGQALPDYNLLNTKRIKPYHSLDMRVDKKWFWKKCNLNLFLDIQNLYGFKTQLQPYLVLQRDATGEPLINPNNPIQYLSKELKNESGTVLPSIGISVEF